MYVQLYATNTYVNNLEIDFIIDRYGKPSLQNNPEFAFNISHSGQWVVVIWSSQQVALGIDVEEIKPMKLDIAEKFFHKSEYLDLLSRQETEQTEYFFQLWTLKESYIKAEGKGLSIPLDTFSLQHCSTLKPGIHLKRGAITSKPSKLMHSIMCPHALTPTTCLKA